MGYTVGETARRLGVPASTLRYYDKEGLLPFVERSPGGIRLFQETDLEWLHVIGCLKQTGMSIKDIRTYIQLAVEGDSTLAQRLELFREQKRQLEKQMEQLRKTMETLDFKCWYYETALAAGSCQGAEDALPDGIPESLRPAYRRLKGAWSGQEAAEEKEEAAR